MSQNIVETDGEKFARLLEEAGFKKVVKVELTPEQKVERIKELLVLLKEAKAVKDEKAGKKIRRQLRKLGFSIRKVMASVEIPVS
jgi:uroporphyrinogen-III synthase